MLRRRVAMAESKDRKHVIMLLRVTLLLRYLTMLLRVFRYLLMLLRVTLLLRYLTMLMRVFRYLFMC